MGIKIAVTGGRNYEDDSILQNALNCFDIEKLYVGDANGADSLAVEWAKFKNIPYEVFKADWSRHGKAAGPIRNREMLKAVIDGVLIAFPGGKGTENCVQEARRQGFTVFRVESSLYDKVYEEGMA